MSEASVKLLSRGVETLTDQELLELLLDDGDSERLAGALLSSFEGRLAALGYADIARLRMAAGIGLKRAARIQAAVELGRRVLAARELGPDPIGSSTPPVAPPAGPVRAVRIKKYKGKTARTMTVRAVFCKAEDGGFENEKIA